MKTANPLSILKNDHDKVKDMLSEYEEKDFKDKRRHLEKIAEELEVHMEMEEKYFYPKFEDVLGESFLVKDSLDDHRVMRGHMKEALVAENENELDIHVREMKSAIYDHVDNEEDEMFSFAQENFEDQFTKLTTEMTAFKLREKGRKRLEELKQKI